MKSGRIGCLLASLTVSGCGGPTTAKPPSEAVQRVIAGRFAAAVLRGDDAAASALLVRTDDGALPAVVRWAAAPWKTHPASIRLPPRHTGDSWTFRYVGRIPRGSGGFETRSGDLGVVVGSSAAGAGVRLFTVSHVRRDFSTHHDSQLLPSKR